MGIETKTSPFLDLVVIPHIEVTKQEFKIWFLDVILPPFELDFFFCNIKHNCFIFFTNKVLKNVICC